MSRWLKLCRRLFNYSVLCMFLNAEYLLLTSQHSPFQAPQLKTISKFKKEKKKGVSICSIHFKYNRPVCRKTNEQWQK